MSLWTSLFGPREEAPRRSTPLSRQEAVDALYPCVQTRPRPEDVAELVLQVLDRQLTESEHGVLRRAAKNSDPAPPRGGGDESLPG
jgi:hypothetical protein